MARPWLCGAVLLGVLIWRLDLYLSRAKFAVIAVLIAALALFAMFVVTFAHAFWWSSSRDNVAVYCIPFLYVSHVAWLLYTPIR